MKAIPDIITNEDKPTAPAPQQFEKLKWAEKKDRDRNSVDTFIKEMLLNMKMNNRTFRSYLDVQSTFNLYSVGNCLLVARQCPQATELKDYDAWKEAGTPVKKGQKSIFILEPGENYIREDGSTGVSKRIKRVFDISQTSREKAIIEPSEPDEVMLLKTLIRKPPVPIEAVDEIKITEKEKISFFDFDRNIIYVKRGTNTKELLFSLARECAMSDLSLKVENYARPALHFKAVCVAYIICKKLGADTKDIELRVPATYTTMEPEKLWKVLEDIRNEANDMYARLSKSIEQNKAPKTKEQER